MNTGIKNLISSKTFGQAVRFGIVGLINTFVTVIIIFVLQNIFSVYFVIANAAGYFVGICSSFILNKFWTFKSKDSVKKEGLLFLLVTGVCYIIQLGVVIMAKEKFGINVNISQFLGMCMYVVLNFLGNKFLTFNRLSTDK